MSNFTFDVFISYSHHDVEWVKNWLLPGLEKAGLRVCVDFRDFKIGGASMDNMADAAKRSRKTLFVMTPDWTISEFSQFEALVAQTIDPIGRKGRLLPLMLKDCDLDTRVQIFSYADFRKRDDWDTELLRVINTIREPQPGSHEPTPLAPNLVHPYLLQANFTGRVEERKALTKWLKDDTQSICAVVAMGGMGKSALAWYWLKNDVLIPAFIGEGVMWWTFYEGESSFSKFIDEALKYVSRQPMIDAGRLPTTYDRAQELLRQLQTKRVLFVLDGFERQLRAYARLDAAYRQDDAADSSADARACIDSIAARLLTNIAASPTRAKILLTTRLMIQDLEDNTGDPLVGVLKRELTELPRGDAAAFMHAQGVIKGTFAEIAKVCDEYGNHPLSLRLLSGLIKRDKRTAGDIAAAPRVAARQAFLDAQHHILEQSYNALHENERGLLSRIAAFRSPTNYDALAIFDDYRDEAAFDAALDELQERGLVQRDTRNDRYDMHPIVRRYAYDRLADKVGVHTRLIDYFANIPVSDINNVQSIEDLSPLIELYHHTVSAGRYDDAAELFRDRLATPLYFRLGAYQLRIELLCTLFPEGEDRPPRLKGELMQAWALSVLANSYAFSGQPRRAALLYKQQNVLLEKVSNKKNLAVGIIAHASAAQIICGELVAAERNLLQGIELCCDVGDKGYEAVGHQALGQLLAYRGAFEEAELSLNIARNVFDGYGVGSTNYVSVVRANHALLSFLKRDVKASYESAMEAFELASTDRRSVYGGERDIIIAEWLLGSALIMEERDLNAAATHLTDALTRCRRINLVEMEPGILLAWARWHHSRGNIQEAQAHAEEALVIADRCEYRLRQAEINNFLARLALDAGDRETARRHAEAASERAWCDGPPHCYKPALDEAKGMLKELGV